MQATKTIRLASAFSFCWFAGACGPASWSIESDSVDGSLTLLDDASEAEIRLVATTSHAGRVNAWVRLPGAIRSTPGPEADIDVPMNEFEQEPPQPDLVLAELVLGDAHSTVRLPGIGGGLSVRCSGERCAEAEVRLSFRVLDESELPSSGVIVDWSARAEAFGEGDEPPAEAMATLERE